jgi:hypothetical protein
VPRGPRMMARASGGAPGAWPGCLRPRKPPARGSGPPAVLGAWRQRPDWRVLTVAAGAPDHWRSWGETRPWGEEGLDVSPAAEQLGAALGAASGEGTPMSQERVET